MINIIIIILIFLLGFCFGGLYGLKQSEELNDEWFILCSKQNDEWSEYCGSLIEKIKTLESNGEQQ